MNRLTREQSRMVDRIAVERYKIPGIMLMENAARGAADVAIEMLAGQSDPAVLVICGGGNNGGDGLAIARHLHNRGKRVRVLLTIDPSKYVGDAGINWNIDQAMGLPVGSAEPAAIGREKPALVVDAIFGTGLSRAPRDPFPAVVRAIHELKAPILAVDIPSGLDCDTGKPLGEQCVEATRTVTFAAEKMGFAAAGAKQYLGQVIVADIGCPPEVIREILKGPPNPIE
jgi:NAD(P)H-hydrate epimerase